MTRDEALLLEQVLSAHRERGPDGAIRPSPAWHDLSAELRATAFGATLGLRELERALHRQGTSTTVTSVLARIRAAPAR